MTNIAGGTGFRQMITMCGIIGCIGEQNTKQTLLAGLHALEYRGYDSAGIAWIDREGRLHARRAAGRVGALEELLSGEPMCGVSVGIGHTRWATHGAPTDRNAHPHGDMCVQIVHNGIIENYAAIRRSLEEEGYRFSSETDTEAAALLLSKLSRDRSPFDAMCALDRALRGAYAIGAIFASDPAHIYALRRESPLIIGLGEHENLIASDVTAILSRTRRYLGMQNGEIAVVARDAVSLYDQEGRRIERAPEEALWDIRAAERAGHAHFMHKEIHEEPGAVSATVSPRIREEMPYFAEDGLDIERLASAEHIHIVACGTAYHAGLYAKRVIERYGRLAVTAEVASEFRYRDPIIGGSDAVLLISQSGETADTLAALRLAKSRGAYTVSIVNAVGSTIAREADAALYTWAGPEIAVASTKAYTVQTALLALLGIGIAHVRGEMPEQEAARLTSRIREQLPNAISSLLLREEEIARLARSISDSEHLFFIGRCADADAASEASLKLKEISYIHSEAYAAGELKHGTISLIEPGTRVIALSTEHSLREKLLGNIKEVSARGAYVIVLASQDGDAGCSELAEAANESFPLPITDPMVAPIVAATALQLLAYHTAVLRGADVDRPRNLAKSVTVE